MPQPVQAGSIYQFIMAATINYRITKFDVSASSITATIN